MDTVNRDRIENFFHVFPSFGYGDGITSGGGYGNGCGTGRGRGTGAGNGDNFRSGYGAGGSYEDGRGYGTGTGSGCGSGAGHANYSEGSDNDGIKSINGYPIFEIDRMYTIITCIVGNVARGKILSDDLTTTPCYIVKQDGKFAHGKTIKEAMEARKTKLFFGMSETERIEKFLEETDRKKPYSARYFFDWHHRLTGSCEMGRNAFVREHGFDLDRDTVTLKEFLSLTKDAYGGDIIKKIIEKLEE